MEELKQDTVVPETTTESSGETKKEPDVQELFKNFKAEMNRKLSQRDQIIYGLQNTIQQLQTVAQSSVTEQTDSSEEVDPVTDIVTKIDKKIDEKLNAQTMKIKVEEEIKKFDTEALLKYPELGDKNTDFYQEVNKIMSFEMPYLAKQPNGILVAAQLVDTRTGYSLNKKTNNMIKEETIRKTKAASAQDLSTSKPAFPKKNVGYQDLNRLQQKILSAFKLSPEKYETAKKNSANIKITKIGREE